MHLGSIRQVFDILQDYAAHALVFVLTIVFGIWAKVVRAAGLDIADKLEKATEKLAHRMEQQNDHMIEFMRQTEARLTRLEAQHEHYRSLISDVRSFLVKNHGD